MKSDAREGAIVALRHFDCVVCNGCVLAAEEDDADIGRIDNGVVFHGLRGTEECDAV